MRERRTFVAGLMTVILSGVSVLGIAGLVLTKAVQAKADEEKAPLELKVDSTPLQRDGRISASFAPVAKEVAPSVVNVFSTVNSKTISGPQFPLDPFFRRFFGEGLGGRNEYRVPKQTGLGSGVVVTKDGYILTNNHVVDGADEIKVALNDGQEFAAKVVGKDPKTDIAVLKIDAEDLPYLTLGDSDQIEIGDLVLAIGNPFGIGQTVTMGMISATGRGNIGLDYEDFIQTDAAINPGNSGGALVDVQGRLVGINTAIISRSGGYQGIGYAVPVNLARYVMTSLVEKGRVIRGFLGVRIQDVTPALAKKFDLDEPEGVLVSEVTPGSAAEKAGVKAGDVILEMNGEKMQDARHLKLLVAETAPGKEVALQILRDGQERTIEVKLKELPGETLTQGEREESGNKERLVGVGVTDLNSAAREQLDLPEHLDGVLVTSVEPDSAAYAAGLRQGDVILEVNRKKVSSAEELVDLSYKLEDPTILLRIWSKGGSRYIVVDERG